MKRIIANTNVINIGKKGENDTRQVVFDISEWLELLGEGTVALIHKRNGDTEPYPCVVKVVGTEALWNIADVDVDKPGAGECELMYVIGGRIAKSVTWATLTSKGLSDASSEVPEPHKSWVDEVIKASTGKSAYEVAVEEGFEGSVDEWLESLVGPKGDTPQKGVDYWNTSDKAEIETYVGQKVIEKNTELEKQLDVVKDIALGASMAISYHDYSQMVATLNVLPKDFFKSGQDINIVTKYVPDIWVAFIEDTHEEYTYVDDETIVQTLSDVGTFKVGYFVLAQRETQKVYVEDLAKKSQVPVIDATLKDNGAYTLTISVGVNE